MMNQLPDLETHHMALFSHMFPGSAYSHQIIPQQGEGKRKRRRRKSKGGEKVEGVCKKRKLSEEQVHFLEENFGNEHKLEAERKDRLASELGLDPRQVAVWFQNRRARWKSQKLEQAYSDLKKQHESTLLHKCRLEAQVSKLKEELSEAEKEIQRLIKRVEREVTTSSNVNDSNNSPSSSLSVEAVVDDPPFLGDFGVEYDDDVFYTTDQYMNGMKWFDLYM